MALTTLDIVDAIYTRLTTAGTGITGTIWTQERPAGWKGEDIVINSLPVNNQALQQAIANVNIHPAELAYQSGGVTDNTFDWQRLNAVVKQVRSALLDYWKDDYHFDVQQEGLIQDGDTFIYNIRVEFYSDNVLN